MVVFLPTPAHTQTLNLIINFQNASTASSRQVVLKLNFSRPRKDGQGKESAEIVLNHIRLVETLFLVHLGKSHDSDN